MVATAAMANFVGFGILFSFGLFLSPLADEFDTSTGAIAPLFSGSVFFYYLFSAVGGRLADVRGPRSIVAIGAVTLPLALLVSSFANSLWQLYVFYMPLAGIAVGSCYSPLIGAVGRRFDRQRPLAIAFLLTGLGGGSLALPLLIRALLDRMDWRGAFQVLAAISAVVLGATMLAAIKEPAEHRGIRRQPVSLFRSAPFRRLYFSVVLIAPGFYAPLAFLNDYAVDQGISTGRAATILAVVGLGSFSTRLAFGGVAQRIGPLRQYRLSHMAMLAALTLWLIAGGSFWLLVISAAIHGIGWAAWVTAAPLVLTEWFGAEDLGLLVGGFYTGLGFGALAGPAISGALIDAAGYRPALIGVIITTVLSLTALLVPLQGGSWSDVAVD